MTINKKIKEVIVVEGKDDTKRINAAVNADTIETRGSAIDEDTLQLIEKVAETRGIIIFTDPDFSGEKIRKIVSEAVPEAKHAFIKKSQAVPERSTGSLGVEHASPEAIREALAHVYTVDDNPVETISVDDLLHFGLMGGTGAKQRRRELSEYLNIGYVNAKQLRHRLAMFQISRTDFIQAMREIEEKNNE
ncbi:ribonuclease M5 [Lentilactobacillus sp. SPB1-3]|uniref:Ribonuclease M5 n=1 Tax=Lentilactobacillus terminaliae TaxID=3003483 RepID=A0ACD5DGZ9_9LACO|nr:ribonuclease M5 [Lentilactobacillus sp. SPB1-3]MCZ0977943.1 ribonuclease M5 [Lentilactobacillus sp. SPB1-3]